MADRHVIYKNGVKEIAFLQGKAVTFMAKWDFGLAGSSCHIHSSLVGRRGRQAGLFHDPTRRLCSQSSSITSPGSWRSRAS